MRLDRHAIAVWNARNRRAREEYRIAPLTNRQVHGPCIRGCGRRVNTFRGVCRYCTKGEK